MYARCTAGLALAALLAGAQSPDATAEDDIGLVITAESSLVVVPLHVYRKKSSVNGLGKESFELYENSERREIAFVEGPVGHGADPVSGRTVPIEIILLVDLSHSVLRKGLLDARTVKASLLDDLGDTVSVSVYGFAGRLTRFAKPTNEPARIQHALERAFAAEAGRTRLYESIVETARDAARRGTSASRMLVVFSDGMSTSDFDPKWSAAAGNAYGIPIYPVVLGHQQIIDRARRQAASRAKSGSNRRPGRKQQGGGNSNRAYQQELRLKRFADLGPQTGGRSYDLRFPSSQSVRKILESLATLARTEYVVGYYPRRHGGEPTSRAVEVRLASKSVGKLYGGRRTIVH